MAHYAVNTVTPFRNELSGVQAFIVDGDAEARRQIRDLLQPEMDINVIGEFSNASDALVALRHNNPDLLVLDVQLPEIQAAANLDVLGSDKIPVTIAMARDPLALRRFTPQVVDVLVKPLDRERFERAMLRAKLEIERARNEELERLLQVHAGTGNGNGSAYAQKFVVKDNGRIFFLRADEIDWIQSAGNYVRMHVGQDVHTIRRTMQDLQSSLDPQRFLRVHRNAIVNLDHILEFQSQNRSAMCVVLKSGARLPLSRSYRSELRKYLKRPL
ncbi:MAG TPA: LytTR family DNA-binding domain-containing protein [Terriglobales bacterium]|nr:LytTR family DNA-binding domain-containing protein [Terriglobales bacterium]